MVRRGRVIKDKRRYEKRESKDEKVKKKIKKKLTNDGIYILVLILSSSSWLTYLTETQKGKRNVK